MLQNVNISRNIDQDPLAVLEQMLAEIGGLAAQIKKDFPDQHKGTTVLVILVCSFSLSAHWAFMFWFLQHLRTLPGLRDITSDMQLKSPQVTIAIDRDKASTLGVTPDQIESALANGFGPRWISTIYAPNNQYQVIIELEDQYQEDPSSLAMLYVHSSTGQRVSNTLP